MMSLELRQERARRVGVVVVDHRNADLALLAVVALAAKGKAEEHRHDERPHEREEHAALVARHEPEVLERERDDLFHGTQKSTNGLRTATTEQSAWVCKLVSI